jgi:hypothetical protein
MGVHAKEQLLMAAARVYAHAPVTYNFTEAEQLRVCACEYARAKRRNDQSRDKWKAKRSRLSYSEVSRDP